MNVIVCPESIAAVEGVKVADPNAELTVTCTGAAEVADEEALSTTVAQ